MKQSSRLGEERPPRLKRGPIKAKPW